MTNCIIYTRVSTDEQAEKGYSLRDQYSKLERYCIEKGYQVAKHFQDDHSAKTFERPQFKALIEYLKQNKGLVSKILVIKWDRFSRNMEHSLNMLTYLHQLGVEVEAIEQPLDNSVPENLLMQAIYLAVPQVENQRRALNTSNGMRRAMKEGKYCATAPQGYLNRRDERGKPILVVDPVKAPLVKEMFTLISECGHSQQQVRKTMSARGLTYSRSQFSNALRNPVYIGKIKVPAYKSESEEIVNGIHEPIIDESIFYRVQAILSGKKPSRKSRIREGMPLRGFIYCSAFDHKMTGSCSHGHGGVYGYYHCANINCERHRADRVNAAYFRFLQSIKPEPEIEEIIRETLIYRFQPDKAKKSASDMIPSTFLSCNTLYPLLLRFDLALKG